MKATNHRTRRDEQSDRVVTLVRSVSVRLVEVSRGGCRLECSSRLESGTSGLLAVELAGLVRVDDIRIARCEPRVGAGAVFQVGAELLKTRPLGRRSLRMAVRNIIGGDNGAGHARQDDEGPVPAEVRTRKVNGKTHGRGPPGTPDRGS